MILSASSEGVHVSFTDRLKISESVVNNCRDQHITVHFHLSLINADLLVSILLWILMTLAILFMILVKSVVR